MEASQIPYKFATPWGADATSGYVTAAIPATASGGAASQQLGFPPITAQPTGSGGIPPNIADINGLGLYATLWAQWQQAGGPVIYDATFATAIGGYPKGAIIAAGALVGNSWLCTVDNNTADPDTGGANWELIGRPFVSNAQGANGDTTWTSRRERKRRFCQRDIDADAAGHHGDDHRVYCRRGRHRDTRRVQRRICWRQFERVIAGAATRMVLVWSVRWHELARRQRASGAVLSGLDRHRKFDHAAEWHHPQDGVVLENHDGINEGLFLVA